METVNKDITDVDFIWEDYLEETKSLAAPPMAFVHVEYSLESGFKKGMKMEVPNREEDNCYWIASVIMTCGPLLSLRYAGYGDDRSADFWFDVKSGDVHPIGWCQKNNKVLSPPKAIQARHKDIKSLLHAETTGANSVPPSLLEDPAAGMTPVDQIKTQMKLEILDELNPQNVWIATIIQNVGGRLLLRYDGTTPGNDFWLFYLSLRVHQVGWGCTHRLLYIPPKRFEFHHPEREWEEILATSLRDAEDLPFPSKILEDQTPLKQHNFIVGMKLEALDPNTLLDLKPATVTKIINNYCFLVSIDVYESEQDKCSSVLYCHSSSHEIFPINFAKENGIKLSHPEGFNQKEKDADFDWDHYLLLSKAKPAPPNLFLKNFRSSGFEPGMRMESVNPFFPDQVCVATITKIVEPLMWIQIESLSSLHPNHMTGIDSFDIFPVGWCESNGYPLVAPKFKKSCADASRAEDEPKDLNIQKKKSEDSQPSSQRGEHGKAWCSKIYFNHRCFSGPMLSKSRLAELPKQIGPGPIALVMKEVLTLLVNVAYKSSRVLRELQTRGRPDPNMQQQIIKAKYKGKSYRATVEFIRTSDQVQEFCRMICKKLECCPYLFGPNQVGEECPENCYSLTKTKFSHNFTKKHKKPGRPPMLSHGNLVSKKGPGRRKKRKHWRLLNNNTLYTANDQKDNINDIEQKEELQPENSTCKGSSDEQNSEGSLHVKKKFKSLNIPKSDIVTRGAKLPNFGLEMKWRHNVSPFLPRKLGRPPGRPSLPFSSRKVGRPLGSKKKVVFPTPVMNLRNSSHLQHRATEQKIQVKEEKFEVPKLESNPLGWSIDDVLQFLRGTDCAPLARIFKEQEIDGQALLMLNSSCIEEFLNLKPEVAKILCNLVEKVKLSYYTYYVSNR